MYHQTPSVPPDHAEESQLAVDGLVQRDALQDRKRKWDEHARETAARKTRKVDPVAEGSGISQGGQSESGKLSALSPTSTAQDTRGLPRGYNSSGSRLPMVYRQATDILPLRRFQFYTDLFEALAHCFVESSQLNQLNFHGSISICFIPTLNYNHVQCLEKLVGDVRGLGLSL